MQSLIRFFVTILVVLTCVPAPYYARGGEEGPPPARGDGAERTDGLFRRLSNLEKEADSLRASLARRGFTFSLCLRADGFLNTRGGLNTHDARRFRWDVSFYGDLATGRAGWWEGGCFHFHVQHEQGEGPSAKDVGDFQGVSNMEAGDFTQVSELWYRHTFLDGRAWIKAGKQDANADFAAPVYGGEFIHASAGFSPTIPLPSFPDPDWGVSAGGRMGEAFSLVAGVYQGRPEGGHSLLETLRKFHGPMILVEPGIHYRVRGL